MNLKRIDGFVYEAEVIEDAGNFSKFSLVEALEKAIESEKQILSMRDVIEAKCSVNPDDDILKKNFATSSEEFYLWEGRDKKQLVVTHNCFNLSPGKIKGAIKNSKLRSSCGGVEITTQEFQNISKGYSLDRQKSFKIYNIDDMPELNHLPRRYGIIVNSIQSEDNYTIASARCGHRDLADLLDVKANQLDCDIHNPYLEAKNGTYGKVLFSGSGLSLGLNGNSIINMARYLVTNGDKSKVIGIDLLKDSTTSSNEKSDYEKIKELSREILKNDYEDPKVLRLAEMVNDYDFCPIKQQPENENVGLENLFIVRHGNYGSDYNLSPEGIREMDAISQSIDKHIESKTEDIYIMSSSAPRAYQSAEIIAKHLNAGGVDETCDFLWSGEDSDCHKGYGDFPKIMESVSKVIKNVKNLVLVTHLEVVEELPIHFEKAKFGENAASRMFPTIEGRGYHLDIPKKEWFEIPSGDSFHKIEHYS